MRQYYALILCLLWFQHAYAGPSVFVFTFYNKTNHAIMISQSSSSNTKNMIGKAEVITSKPSEPFYVAQKDKTASLKNNWFITFLDQYQHMTCRSHLLFELDRLAPNVWRYATVYYADPDDTPCDTLKGVDLDKYTKLANTKLPPVSVTKTGNTRFYNFDILLGSKKKSLSY